MGLAIVEFVIATERAFNIRLPDDECAKTETVGEYVRLIQDKLNASGRQEPEETTYARVLVLLKSELRVPPEKISYDARFVTDLGID